jgi:hypothetical protein
MPGKILSDVIAFRFRCCLRESGAWTLLPPEAGEKHHVTFRSPRVTQPVPLPFLPLLRN